MEKEIKELQRKIEELERRIRVLETHSNSVLPPPIRYLDGLPIPNVKM